MKDFNDNNNNNNNSNNLKIDHQSKMVDKTPSYAYHVTFEAVPPVGLLSTMGPFLNADVTNPRELYSILSESKHQGGNGTTSGNGANAQQNVKLPPLQSSAAEAQFRSLGDQAQANSYPDLTSLSRQDITCRSQLDSVRRSTSLQDVSSLDKMDGLLTSKKLTPIHRPGDAKSPSDKDEVLLSGRTDIQLVKDQPLPPIEGHCPDSKVALSSFTEAGRLRNGDELNFNMDHSPTSHRRLLECPSYIFPRGRPVQVKKPLTPTYDDYPEAYWELRSPTLQEPSDLKEDMIDRDNYRLQQISQLHLRAMNRDGMMNKLDAYRKWQQKMQEHLPPLALSHKLDSSRTAGVFSVPSGGPLTTTDRSWKQHKVSVPVQNHALVLAATPFGISATKRQNDGSQNVQPENTEPVTVPTADQEQQQETPHENGGGEGGGEKDAQEKSKPNGGEKDTQKAKDVKPVKAAVVNLYMNPAPKTHNATSELLPSGLRKTQSEKRIPSGKAAGPQNAENVPPPNHHQQQQQHHNPQGPDPDRKLSTASIEGTRSSSLSHYLQRVPSAPAATPPPTLRTLPGGMATTTNTNRDRGVRHVAEATWRKNLGGKLILNKFNRLQVFGEKGQQIAGGGGGVGGPGPVPPDTPWYVLDVKAAHRRKPYLPQNRPPTYRLDLKNYPPNHHPSDGHAVGVNMEGGGYPILVSERGGMPIASAEHVDPASLSFRFRDGEVIVSRQGRKTRMT